MRRNSLSLCQSLGNLFNAQYNWRLFICFSVSPVCSGELPHLGGNPHSATAGSVPGSWTRGERSVKDLENASEKQRQLTDNLQCTPVDLSGLGRPGDLRSKPARCFMMKQAGYVGPLSGNSEFGKLVKVHCGK